MAELNYSYKKVPKDRIQLHLKERNYIVELQLIEKLKRVVLQ